ncbi:hypothetical protein DPMN_008406 [Dreissena polymorpha]|uniref:Uncharacterized protein n=1 Tax=Dreissena polymorpha TaxID=45954 RepID=A0A9D4RZ81_DREPO|nr:hypothetical protein DPMN_008406 [Dreissena polymorpha]
MLVEVTEHKGKLWTLTLNCAIDHSVRNIGICNRDVFWSLENVKNWTSQFSLACKSYREWTDEASSQLPTNQVMEGATITHQPVIKNYHCFGGIINSIK